MSLTKLAVLSPFVGTRAVVDAVGRLLEVGERLVTITGVAGVGKSRAAYEALSGQDVLWCALTGVSLPTVFDRALARVVGVDEGERELRGATLAAIAESPSAVVVFDDADGSLSELRSWLEEALPLLPRLRVVITSRRRLGIPLEHVHEVHPLGISRHEDTCPALDLWLDLVRRAAPHYSPHGMERQNALEVVELLDGLPLALELAAPKMRVLDAATLAQELRRDAVAGRPASTGMEPNPLRRALDASLEALPGHVQEALLRLTFLPATFLPATAMRYLAALDPDHDAASTLQTLRDGSLVSARTDAERLRLSLLRAVRDFVRSRCEAAVLEREASGFVAHFGAAAREEHASGTDEIGASEPDVLLALADHVASHACPSALESAFAAYALDLVQRNGSSTGFGPLGAATLALCARAKELGPALEPRARATCALLSIAPGLPAVENLSAVARTGFADAMAAHDHDVAADLLRSTMVQACLDDRTTAVDWAIAEMGPLLAHLRPVTAAVLRAARAYADAHLGRRVDFDVLVDATDTTRPSGGSAHVRTSSFASQVALHHQRVDLARAFAAEALAVSRARGYTTLALTNLLFLGHAAHDAGLLADARAHFQEIIEISRFFRAHPDDHRSVARACLAEVEVSAGNLTGALSLLDGLRPSFRTRGNLVRYDAICTWVLAATGRRDEAARRLASLERDAPTLPTLRATARLAIAYAKELLDESAAHRQDVDLAMREAETLGRTVHPLRVFARGVRTDRETRRGTAPMVEDATAWVIEQSGLGFVTPNGELVTLEGSKLLQRVLAKLVEARIEHPLRAVTIEELLAAGWPAERMSERSAGERLRAVTKRLRTVGLSLLEWRRGAGYRLAPAASVRIVDDRQRFTG